MTFMIFVISIGYQNTCFVSFLWIVGSSTLTLLKKKAEYPARVAEWYCFDERRVNFVGNLLESEFAATCPFQWTNGYSTAWSNSPKQIRTFPWFWIRTCNLPTFLLVLVPVRVFSSPSFHMPYTLSLYPACLCNFQEE
jgi:hypothetical protein